MPEDGDYRPAYRRAVDQLISYIADQRLRPGDRLPTELELAQAIGTSQRAVREAIKMLSAIGRVRAERGRGLFVGDDRSLLTGQRPVSFRPTDLNHVAMLFEFRSVQERESALLAANRATPPDIRALAAAVDAGKAAISGPAIDQELFARADDAFHAALAESSHNIFLIDAVSHIRSLQAQVSFLEIRSDAAHVDRAVMEHEQILEAVKAGEAELAADLASAHVRHTLQDYREAIERRLAEAADPIWR